VASLFVSHSSRDRSAAERICHRLRAEGFAALFVDFDPAEGIPAGRNWERELYAQLRKTDALIFLASKAAVASPWSFTEVSLARSLGKPVFPLRLEAGVRLALLEEVQWIDLAEGEPAFARLWAGLRRAGLDPADAFAWDPDRPPYPGLAPFAPEDAPVFFGRDQEVDRLLELLQPTLQRGPGRFVAIVGPSGSGKSSLLRAGLLPRLARLPGRWVLVPALRPGQQPTQNLARSLAAAFAARGVRRPAAELRASLGRSPTGLVELTHELVELSEDSGDSGDRPNVLIVIDQAEELLTRSGVREQQAFLALLSDALGDDSPLWAIATVRSEFLSTAPERAGLAEVIDDPLVIEPLSRARLPEVIQRPAQRAGLEFAPGLVQRMVEEASGGDALPLLAYTLRELYQRTGPDGQITMADYDAVGGVVGALQRRADRLADEFGRRGQGPMVVPTLLRLAAIEGEGEPTRRRLSRSALSTDEQMVVDAFVDARLLTSRKGSGEQEATVEVTHEALLRQWRPLREAIEVARAWLRMRSELERVAADWDHGGRDESYLMRGGRLAAFDRWAGEHAGELGPLEGQFLQASQALAARELTAARRSNRRLQVLAGGLSIFLLIALVAAGVAIQQGNRAEKQSALEREQAKRAEAAAMLATSRQLAALSTSGARLDRSLLLSLEALRLRDTAESRSALLTALQRNPQLVSFLHGDGSAANSVAVSPDGRTLASGTASGAVILWDVAGRRRLTVMAGHEGQTTFVAFSHDGGMLASAGLDGRVVLWDVAGRRRLGVLGRQEGPATVTFSEKGMLASAGLDGRVVLWDVAGRRRLGVLGRHEGGVTRLAFSPNGNILASAGADSRVVLWDVAGRRRLGVLAGHKRPVLSVAFSPDGAMLASGSVDRTIALWNIASRQRIRRLTGHSDLVADVAFSPNGQRLASASADKKIILWNVETGKSIAAPLTGHDNIVTRVVFFPDGKMLASSSFDATVALWRLDGSSRLATPLTRNRDRIQGIALSPNGRILASATDKTVTLWDTTQRRPLHQLLGHWGPVRTIAFSPDSRTLAFGSADGTVNLWDVTANQPLGQPLTGHEREVESLAFSPDGSIVASGGADRTIILWDVASRRRVGRPLTGHGGKIAALAFAPDGRLLASTGYDDLRIILWDVIGYRRSGSPLAVPNAAATSLAFSPDGRTLAAGNNDSAILLWDVATRRSLPVRLTAHSDAVKSVAYSPDGRMLASGSTDKTVILWDAASGRQLSEPLMGLAAGVTSMAFSRSGRILAAGDQSGTILLWDTDVASWRATACAIANRNFSREEWDQIFGTQWPYTRTCASIP
jgi:WD40 repeat protein